MFLSHHVESVCNGSILERKEGRSLVSGCGHEVLWEGTHMRSWNVQILETPSHSGSAPRPANATTQSS